MSRPAGDLLGGLDDDFNPRAAQAAPPAQANPFAFPPVQATYSLQPQATIHGNPFGESNTQPQFTMQVPAVAPQGSFQQATFPQGEFQQQGASQQQVAFQQEAFSPGSINQQGPPPPSPQDPHQPAYVLNAPLFVGSPNSKGALSPNSGLPQFDAQTPQVPERFAEQLKMMPVRAFKATLMPFVPVYNLVKKKATWQMVWFLLGINILWTVILIIVGLVAVEAALSDDSRRDDGMSFGTLVFTVVVVVIVLMFLKFWITNIFFHLVAGCMTSRNQQQESSMTLFKQLCFMDVLNQFFLQLLDIIYLFVYVRYWLLIAVFVYRLVLLAITLRAVYNTTVGQSIGICALYIVLIFAVLIGPFVVFGTAVFATVLSMGSV